MRRRTFLAAVAGVAAGVVLPQVRIEAAPGPLPLPIPESVLADVEYDFWGDAGPGLSESLSAALDQKVFGKLHVVQPPSITPWDHVAIHPDMNLLDPDGNVIWADPSMLVIVAWKNETPYGPMCCKIPVPVSLAIDPDYDIWAEVRPMLVESYWYTLWEKEGLSMKESRARMRAMQAGTP